MLDVIELSDPSIICPNLLYLNLPPNLLILDLEKVFKTLSTLLLTPFTSDTCELLK